MKFFANIALYLTIFVAAIHSQNIKQDAFIISLRYAKLYFHEFDLTVNAFLDNYTRGIKYIVKEPKNFLRPLRVVKA